MKNPQAFPIAGSFRDETPDVIIPINEGMTLLDYFAGQFMTDIDDEVVDKEKYAKYCYDMAEAMLKEREKRLK